MDFSSLLGLAQEKQSSKVEVKRYSTKFSGPKKLPSPKEKKLSENVRRFMEKKEEEERSKREEATRRTQALLAKRSQDKKSMKTMKSMLQRTKSANKAVVPLESNQTASTLAGRNQCDEDDYGYESGAAHTLYDKLMKKYEANKIDPQEKIDRVLKTPKEIRSTLNRVKSALDTSEEESAPRRRHRKSNHQLPSPSVETSPRTTVKSKKDKEQEARKRRLNNATKRPPPTSSFNDLIKMAQAKASGQPLPGKTGTSSKTNKASKDFEFHRPMTSKMKEEFKREYMSRLRKAGKLPMSAASNATTVNTKKNPPIPKKPIEPSPGPSKKAPEKCEPPPKRDINSVKPREFPGEKKVSRPPPPSTKRRSSPSPPPPPSYRPSSSKKLPPKRNRIESESEEDYDSEMDDFIDDTDAKVDISAQIRGIFGYDRRKFRDEEDFDDRSMVANYSTIMKEEIRSAKIGKMEDLEDMKREEEELQMKMAKKKRR